MFFFVNRCASCGKVIAFHQPLCEKCRTTLHCVKGDLCRFCGREIYACDCRRERNHFCRCVSPYRYDGAAAGIVKRLKFYRVSQVAPWMAKTMQECIEREYRDLAFDVLTFVPSDRIREILRGYDHCRLIADALSNLLDLPCKSMLLHRFSLHQQKKLTEAARRKNVRGKFKPKVLCRSQTVLLIDDVTTTGATLDECARVLRLAGAKEVYCATFAITYKK